MNTSIWYKMIWIARDEVRTRLSCRKDRKYNGTLLHFLLFLSHRISHLHCFIHCVDLPIAFILDARRNENNAVGLTKSNAWLTLTKFPCQREQVSK